MSRAQGSCRGRRNPQKQPPGAQLLWEQWEKQRSRSWGGLCPLPPAWVTRCCQPCSCSIHPGRQRTRSSHSPLASGTSRSGAARIPSASRPEPPRTRPAQSKHRRGQAQQEPSPAARRQRGPAPAGNPRKALSRPHSPGGGDRDVPVLTTASRKLTQRASSGRVSQNCRNSARPMGCLSHRLW